MRQTFEKFYPHPNMQRFLPMFKDGLTPEAEALIEFCDWHNNDVQDLLRRCACLVTDYSSIAMDVAYMEKPLVYYQFDQDDFRANQYEEGYFDYVRDGFGPVCVNQAELRHSLVSVIAHGMHNSEPYIGRERAFFQPHDMHNCERTFDALQAWIERS